MSGTSKKRCWKRESRQECAFDSIHFVGSLSSGDRVQKLSSKVERRSSVSDLQGRENEMWEVDGGHPFMSTVCGESKHGVGILSHWRWRRCIVKVENRNARLMIVFAEDPLEENRACERVLSAHGILSRPC